MINLSSRDDVSRLLFLSDLYRDVLGVAGHIVHLGPATEYDGSFWGALRNTYEPVIPCRPLIFAGDTDTLQEALDHSLFPVALVYFDDCDYKLTLKSLELIAPRLTRGSVLAFSMQEGQERAIAVFMGPEKLPGFGAIALQRWHHSRRDCYIVIGG